MLSNLRILHPPCSDNPTDLSVLLLCVDAQRYIFNAPEGTTRSLIQQGCMTSLKAVNNVFIPRVGIKECGGLPGIAMSMADVGCRQLTIHGPPVTTHYLATCRAYLRRDSLKVQVNETTSSLETASDVSTSNIDDYTVYRDDHITVQAIPLLPTGFKLPPLEAFGSSDRPLKRQRSDEIAIVPTPESLKCLEVMFPNDAEQPALEEDEKIAEEMAIRDAAMRNKFKERTAATFQDLGQPPLQPMSLSSNDRLTEQGPALMYVVRGKDIEGKVDAEKANLFGVPSGRLLATLKKGEDVEITRPKAWASYGPKERSAWYSYCRGSTSQRKGKAQPKKRTSPEQSSTESDMSAIETEQVTVKSSEVVGKARAGFVFVQIYLPSVQYLESFLQASKRFFTAQPHTIIHSVHSDVLQDQRYQDFVHRMKESHHLIVSRSFLPDRLAFPTSALANMRMGHLDKHLFPPPVYSLDSEMKLESVKLEDKNVYLAELDTNIKLHPPGPPALSDERALNLDHPIDSDKVKRLVSFQDMYGNKLITDNVRKSKAAAWQSYLEHAKVLQRQEDNSHRAAEYSFPLKVTTLGTGSASPSKYRNVSGALVHMPGKDAGYILLDAGESTYSQIARKFGKDGVDDVLANIRLIFLSHIHGDHHMGVTRMLAERAKLNVKRPLFVVAPSFIRRYLEEVNMIQSLGISNVVEANGVILINSEHLDSKSGVVLDVKAYPNEAFNGDEERLWKKALEAESINILRKQGHTSFTESTVRATVQALHADRIDERQRTKALCKHMTQVLHGTQVFTALVDHRVSHSYGVIFRGKDWSGAYSGDTRPCHNLVEAGKGVDFLLHEATMEDELEVMAHKKGHSTSGQAIDIARQMGVKYVILTHFSQRYAKLPRINTSDDLGGLKVGFAFDLLTMQMSDLDKLMRYREALQLLYDVDQEEDNGSDGEVQESSTSKQDTKAVSNGVHHKKGDEVEEVAMAVDGASISGAVAALPGDQIEQTMEGGSGKESQDQRLFQRRFVKTHEFQYVSFELRPIPSKKSIVETGFPSRLSVAKAIETSLVDLNGIVNGSFNWDLLDVKPILTRNIIRVVVKAPSSHIETLRASIAAGLSLRLGETSFQARYDRTFSALDLVAVETDNSQQWFDDVVKQRNDRSQV